MFTNVILPWQSRGPASAGRCPANMALPRQLLAPSESGLWHRRSPWPRPGVAKLWGASVVLVWKTSVLPHVSICAFLWQWPGVAGSGSLWWANKALGRTVCSLKAFAHFFLSGTYFKKQLIKYNLSRLVQVTWYKLIANERTGCLKAASGSAQHYVNFFLMTLSSFWSSLNVGRFSGL